MQKKYDYAIVIILFLFYQTFKGGLTFADDSKGCGSAACK